MTQQRLLSVGPSPEHLRQEAERVLRTAKALYRPVKTFALVSGGRDSTAMLEVARDYIDAVVHINTGIGIPETTEFVRSLVAGMDLDLIEMRTPPEVYRDIVLGPTRKGFPGPKFHYICYHLLKSQRLQELQRDHAKRGERLLLVSGVRRHESRRRMNTIAAKPHEGPSGRLGKCAWVKPLWDWTSEDLANYEQWAEVPRNPVTQYLHRSGECLCGAFASRDELKEIALWYPATAAYLRELEAEAVRLGKPNALWAPGGTRPKRRAGLLCSGCSLVA